MLKIVVGCYEQLVMGYSVSPGVDEKKWEFSPYFTDHSQNGCIKSVAAGSTYIATASTDETICLYNMTEGTELGTIKGHSGAVMQLLFPDNKHLISCSEDGTICMWEVGPDGNLLKTLRGHKGTITSIATHPSGKLGMSVSPKDGSLRTWNLMTGRSVYIKNMKKLQPEYIRWSLDGKYYVVASLHVLQVYELESAKCVHETTFQEQILAMEFLPCDNEHRITIGNGVGEIVVFDTLKGECKKKFKAHENRVKCLHSIKPGKQFSRNPDEVWLATGSSDGDIKMWKFDEKYFSSTSHKAECLLTINTNARLTSLAIWQKCEETKLTKTSKENLQEIAKTKENNKTEVVQRKRKLNKRLKQKRKLQKLLFDE